MTLMHRRHLWVLVFVAGACSEPTAPRETPGVGPLVGTWQHLQTCGGMSPTCFGGGGHVVFQEPDSMIARDGAVTTFARRVRYVSDAETMYGTYPSIEEWLDEEGEWRPLFTVLQLTADSLHLGDNATDGFTMSFKRLSGP